MLRDGYYNFHSCTAGEENLPTVQVPSSSPYPPRPSPERSFFPAVNSRLCLMTAFPSILHRSTQRYVLVRRAQN